ncbi:hypothetical protein PLICRDRAFT_177420 [Plicaturopsis crispa FD-325 SS-3]|nr:hypothetical protein PLICRDRAFT_177420 [Plicaturopsis crispa FD-325 SS-3]
MRDHCEVMTVKELPRANEPRLGSESSVTVTSPIAVNAVGSLTLKSANLRMKRVSPPPVNITIPQTESFMLPDGTPPPPPPPSVLPPPGNITIDISLRKRLGRGRSGLVYAIDVSPNVGLPPLVAKVARIGHQSALIREAAVYERLECIQGFAVPLCYGAFEGHLDDGRSLGIDPNLMRYRENREDAAYVEALRPDCVERQELELQRRGAAQPGWICILLLERLGHEHLPLYQPIEDSTIDDLYDIYEDLATLQIIHGDIRYHNILSVGPSTSAAICPWHGYAHRYRVYDFENAKLYAAVEAFFEPSHTGWDNLHDCILPGLPKGRIYELSCF